MHGYSHQHNIKLLPHCMYTLYSTFCIFALLFLYSLSLVHGQIDTCALTKKCSLITQVQVVMIVVTNNL